MKFNTLRELSFREWVFALAGAGVIVFLVLAAVWTGRHGWAIHKLGRGVGDTVFYDAMDQPWFRLDEQRQDVPLDHISVFFKDAVIAVEDHRYYRHPGIDPIGLTRAVFHNLGSSAGRQGGSTITQQLARTLFLSNTRTYGRKVQEAVLAVMMEVLLSKTEILELYLNRVYLSAGVAGVETMSRKLLHKPASELTLAEASLIAGVIRAPAAYSPWFHPDAARTRREVVLRRMREEGKITAEQERSARDEPLHLFPNPAVANARHGYAKEYLRQRFRDLHGDDNPPDWQVHTTLVPEIQDAAEGAVRDGLRRLGIDGLQAALVAIDPTTGNLLAIVGGSDYGVTPFNRAVRSRRQPGSAFKPLVYAAALEHGLSPVSMIEGLRQVRVSAPEGVWIPRDERVSDADALTLREALSTSSNAAAVLLQQQVGVRLVLRLALDLGVSNQPEVPSLALGSGLVTPLDLTAAYAVFPGRGMRVRPRALVDVRDASGGVIDRVHVERAQILSAPVAFQMVTMLQDVVDRGTGATARTLGVRGAIAGKTGTTNDYHDAWFVGFSSSVVAGVWVGFDQPARIGNGASGARIALPIWADFMRRTARRLPSEPFAPSGDMRTVELCRVSHQRPVEGCPTYVEHFKAGDAIPTHLCTVHTGSVKQSALRVVQGAVQRGVQGALSAIGRGIRNLFSSGR